MEGFMSKKVIGAFLAISMGVSITHASSNNMYITLAMSNLGDENTIAHTYKINLDAIEKEFKDHDYAEVECSFWDESEKHPMMQATFYKEGNRKYGSILSKQYIVRGGDIITPNITRTATSASAVSNTLSSEVEKSSGKLVGTFLSVANEINTKKHFKDALGEDINVDFSQAKMIEEFGEYKLKFPNLKTTINMDCN
jgi:hypothetical protein